MQNNNWLMSKRFNQCSLKLKNLYGIPAVTICSNSIAAKKILTQSFDTCSSALIDTNISKRRRVTICSSQSGQSQVQCYDKLRIHVPSKSAWSSCTNNYTTKNAVLDSDFSPCMKSMLKVGINASSAVSVCTDYQAGDVSQCIVNSSGVFDVNTLANKCHSYSFREANQNPDFGKCILKLQKNQITKSDAIDMCSVSEDELDLLVNSKTFDRCLVSKFGQEIPNIDRYSICADPKTLKLLSDHSYKKCLSRGFNSGIMNYFDLKSKENTPINNGINNNHVQMNQAYSNTNKITPWTYVFKDCAGDYKYRNKSKSYNKYLKVYKDYNIHTDSLFESDDLKIGGLSAVRFNEETNKVYFLSDDRGFNTNASPRIYSYDYVFTKNGELELSESHIISLTRDNEEKKINKVVRQQNTNQIQMNMDPEGFDFTNSGDIIISSELDDLMANDFLSIFTPDGKAFETIPLNDDFKPTTTKKKTCHERKKHKKNNDGWGIWGSNGNSNQKNSNVNQNSDEDENKEEEEEEEDTYEVCNTVYTQKGFLPNKSLESLSLTPNKSHMFTANEDSLYQDIRQDNYGRLGKRVRIIRYTTDINGKFKEDEQYYYRLEKAPDNGLVEILALNKDSILTLERSWDNIAKKITSRVYLVNLKNAQNILQYSKDSRSRVRSLKKELILDLDDIKYELSPGFRKVDNIEGMSFGPKLPNGKDSIVLVSDNNFRTSQRSMIIILELNLNKLLKLTK
jgi:hypothetical protein